MSQIKSWLLNAITSANLDVAISRYCNFSKGSLDTNCAGHFFAEWDKITQLDSSKSIKPTNVVWYALYHIQQLVFWLILEKLQYLRVTISKSSFVMWSVKTRHMSQKVKLQKKKGNKHHNSNVFLYFLWPLNICNFWYKYHRKSKFKVMERE